MKTVYVIFYEGPEWNDPIEGYMDKTTAKRRAKELEKMRQTGPTNSSMTYEQVQDRLSEYIVKPITIMDMP